MADSFASGISVSSVQYHSLIEADWLKDAIPADVVLKLLHWRAGDHWEGIGERVSEVVEEGRAFDSGEFGDVRHSFFLIGATVAPHGPAPLAPMGLLHDGKELVSLALLHRCDAIHFSRSARRYSTRLPNLQNTGPPPTTRHRSSVRSDNRSSSAVSVWVSNTARPFQVARAPWSKRRRKCNAGQNERYEGYLGILRARARDQISVTRDTSRHKPPVRRREQMIETASRGLSCGGDRRNVLRPPRQSIAHLSRVCRSVINTSNAALVTADMV
jgi:hypothetical protein